MLATMSPFNKVLLSVFVAGAVWAAWHGVYWMAALLVIGALWALWAVRVASRATTGDTARLDAAQPTDERERRLLERSLALVGMVAVVSETVVFVWRVGARYPDDWGSSVRLPLICLVWLIANRLVVRGDLTRA